MSNIEKLEIYMEIKKKQLKLKDIAAKMNVSTSLLSQFLNNKGTMSKDNQFRLKEIVHTSKEFVWKKVYLD